MTYHFTLCKTFEKTILLAQNYADLHLLKNLCFFLHVFNISLLMVITCAIQQISCWMKKFVLQNRKIVKSRSYLTPLIFPHHQYSCIKNSLKLIVREIGLFQAFGLEKIHNAQVLKLSFRNISQNTYYLAILV